ncbi:hypothetical protein NVIRENTERO_03167 [Sodalis praecaptivus]|nr:hypothetical protein NVIRENTERO_03167 [Sodalis praecaptivus]
MLIITITGNVVLCYEDNREEVVFGNVFTTPIMAIWDAPAFREAREALARGNRNATPIWRRCPPRCLCGPHTPPSAFCTEGNGQQGGHGVIRGTLDSSMAPAYADCGKRPGAILSRDYPPITAGRP